MLILPALVEREPMWDGNKMRTKQSKHVKRLSENQCGMETYTSTDIFSMAFLLSENQCGMETRDWPQNSRMICMLSENQCGMETLSPPFLFFCCAG